MGMFQAEWEGDVPEKKAGLDSSTIDVPETTEETEDQPRTIARGKWGLHARPEDIPSEDADWARIAKFALLFDAYRYAASKYRSRRPISSAQRLHDEVRLALQDREEAPEGLSIEDLRGALYFLQKAILLNEPWWRCSGSRPSDAKPARADGTPGRKLCAPPGQDCPFCSDIEFGRKLVRCIKNKLEGGSESSP